jgi:translocation and assembly module TamB
LNRIVAATTALLIATTPIAAQEDEEPGGMLVGFLEGSLSGDNRQIKVTGLEGALSSQATIKQLTVSDDEGVWLSIDNAVLDWNRLALIRGRFSVNALTAQSIEILRAPNPGDAPADIPEPGATPFQVPELPVAVEIGELRVDRLELGKDLAGVAAELAVKGALQLADGALNTDLAITRLDRPGDGLKLDADFENKTSQITLDLTLDEASGGLLATSIGIPGAPTVQFSAKGSGPVSDFVADIRLSTDGAERLSGKVELLALTGADADAPKSIGFKADLGGDVRALMIEDYQSFFGPQTHLTLDGQNDPDGRMSLRSLSLESAALDLGGTLSLAPGGVIEHAVLNAKIAPVAGQSTVVLPLGEPRTAIDGATISLRKTAETGDLWDIAADLRGLDRPDVKLREARISANGSLDQDAGLYLDGLIAAGLDGLEFSDPDLAQAVGSAINLRTRLLMQGDGAVQLRDLALTGSGYSATGEARFDGLDSGMAIDGDLQIEARDLSRFSGIAGQDLGGSVRASITGNGAPLSGSFDVDMDLQARNLRSGLPEIDPLIEGETALQISAARTAEGLFVDAFDLSGPAVTANGQAKVTGAGQEVNVEGNLKLQTDDLSRFSRLSGQDLGGAIVASVSGTGAPYQQDFDIELDLKATDLRTGLPEIDPLIQGEMTLQVGASKEADRIRVDDLDFVGQAMVARGDAGLVGRGEEMVVDADLKLLAADLSRFAALAGRDLAGSVSIDVAGNVAPTKLDFDVDLEMRANDLKSGVNQLDLLIGGPVTLDLRGAKQERDIRIDRFELSAQQLSAHANGTLDDQSGNLTFKAVLADLGVLVPQMPGAMTLTGDVSRQGEALAGLVRLEGPNSSYAEMNGTFALDGTVDIAFDAKHNQLERFLPEFPGSVAATGTAIRRDAVWQVDGTAEGPAGIKGGVKGSWDETAGTADIATTGQLRLDAANEFIKPNSVSGTAQFDLALKGPPELNSLSGRITTNGTTLAIPAAWQSIEGISANIDIADSRANMSVSGKSRAGGGFQISGPLALTAPFDGSVTTRFNGLVLTDNLSFTSTANGQLVFSGPLAGNGNLAGQINFSDTEINVASASGGISVAPIPDITHVGERGATRTTRDRAGLIQTSSGGDGPVIGLDILLSAPNKIFARGRGLQAELGGEIRVRGTTANVAPSGQIQLIRGTFNILGRRLDLTEGIITLQGSLTPYLQFQSTANTSEGSATIEISGPMDQPEIKVYSDPPRPSEEALALLLFGDNFDDLSPLALAQMAASVARLSGASDGTNESLREGLGTDTAEVGVGQGGAQLGGGRYLAENVYTDFTVNTKGETELNLNLDVTETLTLRGTVDNKGETGIGIFFQRDY